MTTPASTRQAVTQLLGDWSGGDDGALEKLFPLVQPELHRLADRYMRRERAGRTLQTIDCYSYQAYLRIVDDTKTVREGPTYFIAAVAQLMRRIMIDHISHSSPCSSWLEYISWPQSLTTFSVMKSPRFWTFAAFPEPRPRTIFQVH